MILTHSFANVIAVAVLFGAILMAASVRSRVSRARWIIAAILTAALFQLPGCQRVSTSTAHIQDSTGDNSLNLKTGSSSGQIDSVNRCALLTEDEVQEAIGPHSAGVRDVSELSGKSVTNNFWGFHSCRWTATTAQKIEGFPNGWFDKIEIKVFDKEKAQWAQKQAEGEPVNGFLDGALYDHSYGKLWFNCGHGQYCLLTADTAAGEKREALARHLAELVEKRLR